MGWGAQYLSSPAITRCCTRCTRVLGYVREIHRDVCLCFVYERNKQRSVTQYEKCYSIFQSVTQSWSFKKMTVIVNILVVLHSTGPYDNTSVGCCPADVLRK